MKTISERRKEKIEELEMIIQHLENLNEQDREYVRRADEELRKIGETRPMTLNDQIEYANVIEKKSLAEENNIPFRNKLIARYRAKLNKLLEKEGQAENSGESQPGQEQ